MDFAGELALGVDGDDAVVADAPVEDLDATFEDDEEAVCDPHVHDKTEDDLAGADG